MVDLLRHLRRLFSVDEDEGRQEATAESPQTATDGGPPETGQLVYECPGCGEVYLSEAPHTCSACGETTTAVSPADD